MERSPAGMKLPFDAPKLGCWRVPSASWQAAARSCNWPG